MWITPDIKLGEWEISEQFVRASGPGGQNVNKVATAVELRFAAARSPSLPEAAKRRLKHIAGQRWTRDGTVVIQVSETRSQARNRTIARSRLADMIRRSLARPKPRVKTSVPPRQRRKRLEQKKRRSAIKALRRSGEDPD